MDSRGLTKLAGDGLSADYKSASRSESQVPIEQPLAVQCPGCGAVHAVTSSKIGRNGTCKGCGRHFQIRAMDPVGNIQIRVLI